VKGTAVVATGKFTEMGKIQEMVGSATPTDHTHQTTRRGWHSTGFDRQRVCTIVFGIGLLRGYGFLQMLKTAISLAVAAVPEGLPTIANNPGSGYPRHEAA